MRGKREVSLESNLVIRWQDWSGRGLEHLTLTRHESGWTTESCLIGGEAGEPFAATYEIRCDNDWAFQRCRIRILGGASLELHADGLGNWRDAAGVALPSLKGALEIDISATPFTNTLPICRLNLQPGQSHAITAAYIHLPDLTVTLDPQRYTRLAPSRYLYESLDSDFTREITVDEHGLVVLYPGLFRRV